MRSLSSSFTTARAMPHPASERPAGQRSGEGADSTLPALQEDEARRPESTAPSGMHPAADVREHGQHAQDFTRPRQVGRYLVSPLVKQAEHGGFTISVSIRSGSGSATTDRVLRLAGVFPCPREAAAYARAEALHWMTPASRSPAAA